jgi:uncharacterized protein GlcG (DUF336 family)
MLDGRKARASSFSERESMKVGYKTLLASLLAIPGAAWAQGTLITEQSISTDAAIELARAALQACRKHGSGVSITVLDAAGRTKIALRDDGAAPHSVEHSLRKAYTALTYRMPSGEYGTRAASTFPGSHGPLHLTNITTSAGGLPIFAGNTLIGAVGISGTPGAGGAGSGGGGAADAACAQAGIDRIAKGLGG